MKILIVSTSDIKGGAAKASYRLHKSLLSKNIDSQMLVQSKTSDDYTILTEERRWAKYFDKLRPIIAGLPVRFYKYRTKTPFSSSWFGFSSVVDKINEINPDIVHLHWICGGMMKIEDLAKIKAPIVWSLHDMWAFTGGCHYDENCNAYTADCGNCKVLGSKKTNDLSRKVLNRKLKTYSKMTNIIIVGSSRWISGCAKKSTLFKKRKIVTLPNCIDSKLFLPIDKNLVRGIFDIPKDKKVILFGAVNSLGDLRKGAKELFIAINLLKLKDTVFVISGSSRPKKIPKLKYPVYFIPPLEDEVSLPIMYNVADVMIVPSLQENLANSIAESLSCGIPVVAFDIGGNKDMIEHKKNGYLSKPKNPKDMAAGIEWVLENNDYSGLAINARKTILSKFDSCVVSSKYIDLYKEMSNI
ncbi:glycosyltransferase family 4 protein [Candidatus Thioglobus sp.]|nr:glycosyltransferase family 4 protein [Candidatus Thioglobus sp.]